MSDGFEAADFIAGFTAEAEEHLSSANTNLLSIEDAAGKGQSTPRQVRELFRSFHTIKGLAAMVGVEPIVDIAHAMESVLREADRAAGRLPAGAVSLLLTGVKAVENRVQALAKRKTVAAAPAKLVDALNALRQAGGERGASVDTSLPADLWSKLSAAERAQLTQGLSDGRRALVAQFVPTPARASEGVTITSVRERVSMLAEIVKVVPQAMPASDSSPGGLAFALILLTDESDAELAVAAATTPEALTPVALIAPVTSVGFDEEPTDVEVQHRGVVRVEVTRLDEALERLSALVVTQFRLRRTTADLRAAGADVRALAQVIAENGRQLRDLRASIMRARMVSVTELLERIPLIVRGLTRAIGKDARLSMTTGKAELDKAVAERIFPAIVHLIRNAVDHALETPAQRRADGKPEIGLVTVTCHELSDSQLELTVTDDGRGVDAVAVARRAGAAVPTTDEGLLALLTRPGLSTKTEVTTTSGRGVGMDVVKRIAVDELRGELSMRTTKGQGTSFSLRIPLSITIVDAFSFVCAGETFVVPVAMVEEIQEIDLAQTVRGPDRRRTPRGEPDRRKAARATDMIHRRGETVPVLRLDEVLGLVAGDAQSRKAIIVRRNGEPFAFTVERMLGQQEVVVRPLEDQLVRVHGVSGTTDLGDGRPTLVLDLAALGGRLLADSTGGPS
ncbi:MAG TPA: chemotaxis protein CheW [Polyangia bacterium]|nr:chemotaxis protein CheW [Polyangia bacterium]